MLKVLGSMMLFGGCAGMGLLQIRRMDKRIKTLRSLISALEIMERELSFRMPLLEEMLFAAAGSVEGATGSFLLQCRNELIEYRNTPFHEVWDQAAKEHFTALKERDFLPLSALGSVLGRYDSQAQQQAISQARAALTLLLESAAAERGSQGKVYGVLGTTAGAFLVILLL